MISFYLDSVIAFYWFCFWTASLSMPTSFNSSFETPKFICWWILVYQWIFRSLSSWMKINTSRRLDLKAEINIKVHMFEKYVEVCKSSCKVVFIIYTGHISVRLQYTQFNKNAFEVFEIRASSFDSAFNLFIAIDSIRRFVVFYFPHQQSIMIIFRSFNISCQYIQHSYLLINE